MADLGFGPLYLLSAGLGVFHIKPFFPQLFSFPLPLFQSFGSGIKWLKSVNENLYTIK